LSRLVGASAERDAADDCLDSLELRLRDALVAAEDGARRAKSLRFIDCANEARRGLAGGLNVKYALKTMILKMLSRKRNKRKLIAHIDQSKLRRIKTWPK
jgi:hypothetical protein